MVYLNKIKNSSEGAVITPGWMPLRSENTKLGPNVPLVLPAPTVPTGSWIQTFSGGRFWPLDPQPEHVKIEDIAHGLSNQCRFAGQVRDFYSIAQHSVLVSMLCPAEDRLWGLLHDSPEAYSCDLPRPIKYDPRIKPVFKDLEGKLEAAIMTHFGLPLEEPASVKAADKRLLFTERRDLLPRLEWLSDSWGMGLEGEPLPYHIDPWTPKQAEEIFLAHYKELANVRSSR